jgi:isopentenyl-diphosphate Delta-isomerase
MAAKEYVILVDQHDREIGKAEKLQAHHEGLLHRAFSLFIFNDAGDMLIHQRALSKYHSGGLWTNACCSHPRPAEPIEQAVHRRLYEELGFDCQLFYQTNFIYKVRFDEDNLFEHEFDHVFKGIFNGTCKPNPDEVTAIDWIPLNTLYNDVITHPEKYTAWFKIALKKIVW